MDEIFDRIKAIKIKRKDLYLPLILSEILGIIVLVWFLRVPLSQKYLLESPSNYLVQAMDENTQYLLRQGDFISGNAPAHSKLQILFMPDGLKYTLSADPSGNFSFQIPPETRTGEYRLLIVKEGLGNLKPFKNLRIRVESNNKISRSVNSLF